MLLIYHVWQQKKKKKQRKYKQIQEWKNYIKKKQKMK